MQPVPYEIAVLNYHLDGYGHVNNARYLEFLEAARWHFFGVHTLREDLCAANLVVSRADIRYRQAAKLDDVLHIHSTLTSVQSRQVILSQRVVQAANQTVCALAEITLMPTTSDGKVCRLPATLWTHLIQIMETSS